MEDHHLSRWPLAVLCGAGAIAALLLHLFVPSAVGMAGPAGGQGIVCQLGMAHVAPFNAAKDTGYLYPSWVPHQWYGESCGYGTASSSSRLLLLWVAKQVTPLVGLGPGVDLRVVGVLGTVVFGILVTLLVTQLPGRQGFRALVAAALTAVMDSGVFADFFTSSYPAATTFLGLLALLVALLFFWRHDHVSWGGILTVTLAAAFAIAAAPRMAGLVPVIAAALLWRPYRARRRARTARHSQTHRLRSGVLLRLPAALAVVILAVGTGLFLATQQAPAGQQRLYDAVFQEILPHSAHPRADLEWFGLNPDWASSAGTTMTSPGAATFDPDWPAFARKVTAGKILVFAATHPDTLVPLADQGLEALAHPTLTSLGSYLPGSHHAPGSKEHRFPLVEGLSTVFAALPLLILLSQVVAITLAAALAYRRHLGDQAVAFGRTGVFLVAAVWTQFWTVMLLDGGGQVNRHMITTTFLSTLCLVWIATCICLLRQRPDPAPHLPTVRSENAA